MKPVPQLLSRPFVLIAALLACSGAAFVVAAASDPVPLNGAGMAKLETLRLAPETAGARVYRGTVFALGSTGGPALFTYERRVAVGAEGLSAAHITRDPAAKIIIAEEARFTPTYALQRFEATNLQQGFSGAVEVSQGGRQLAYRLNMNGLISTATEAVSDPVVSGPTVHGFVLQHWDELLGGKTLPVRMLVLAEKTSYGFEIRHQSNAGGLSSFSISPSSMFVRMAIAPMKVSFVTASKALVSYEGRVPPMRVDGLNLKTLDARVDYVMDLATYR